MCEAHLRRCLLARIERADWNRIHVGWAHNEENLGSSAVVLWVFDHVFRANLIRRNSVRISRERDHLGPTEFPDLFPRVPAWRPGSFSWVSSARNSANPHTLLKAAHKVVTSVYGMEESMSASNEKRVLCDKAAEEWVLQNGLPKQLVISVTGSLAVIAPMLVMAIHILSKRVWLPLAFLYSFSPLL